jgi:putative CocE/NonD family hydrolase
VAPSRIAVEIDLAATMRDGTVLRADVYRPVSPGPWPVLLARTPYDKQDPGMLANLDPEAAARRGFLVVIQDTRGRHRSEGRWEPSVHERDDGYDTVRWAAHLPGADGRVCMYGPSYLGHTQWAALISRPPELVAAAPEFTWSDPHDGLVARDGARELGLVTQWTLSLGADVLLRRYRAHPAELRHRMARLAEAQAALRTRTYWELPADHLPTLRELRLPAPGRPDAPSPLRIANPLPGAIAPTLTVAGWYDAFLQGSLDNHVAAHEADRRSRLIVGPWSHGNQSTRIGEVDFGPSSGADALDGAGALRSLELDWFDDLLRPGPSNEAEAPAALIFIMGVNRWRHIDRWPPRATKVPWYFHPDRRLSPAPPPEHQQPDAFQHDPANPVPTHGGALLLTDDFPAGPLDQREAEQRPDVLAFTSAPLAEALEVVGRVRAHLIAASSAPSTDWIVRLCDVAPDGTSLNITDGVVRVEHAAAEPREHTIDLWSTAHVFLPGHRLRVQVTSSNFPRWDRNLGGATEIAAASAPLVARQFIFHDAARPSHILLPVTAGARVARDGAGDQKQSDAHSGV